MPKVNVTLDQDVYNELGKHVRGFETPNDVLRRMLFGEQSPPEVGASPSRRPGGLMKLIVAGLIDPGDRFIHHQKRKGATHEATVETDGWLTTKLGLYSAPSPALSDLVGTSISGTDFWIHEPTGKTINQLKALL